MEGLFLTFVIVVALANMFSAYGEEGNEVHNVSNTVIK